MFGYITLLTGLALSVVAAWFAIEGVMAIFAGMAIYAMIMGIVIEAGKVVGVTWIYRHWKQRTNIKFAMLPAVIVAMMLTSMGIFGLLSKAHLEQTSPVTNNTARIERLDLRIAREEREIADAEAVISQLDEVIQTLIDYDKISDPEDGAIARREQQRPQREQLKQIIDESLTDIANYEDEKLTLMQELNAIALEVGPVKYIAALVYEDPENSLEEAVRWVIIAFIFVFDPMAIMLIMAGNFTIDAQRARKEEEVVIDTVIELDSYDDEPTPKVNSVDMLPTEIEADDIPDTEPESERDQALDKIVEQRKIKEQIRSGDQTRKKHVSVAERYAPKPFDAPSTLD